MCGDFTPVAPCKDANAFGTLGRDRRDLGAANHGGRGKPRLTEMRDDDIVVPPAVLRGCGRRVAEISDEITRPQMTETHSPPPLRGPLCILLEWQVPCLYDQAHIWTGMDRPEIPISLMTKKEKRVQANDENLNRAFSRTGSLDDPREARRIRARRRRHQLPGRGNHQAFRLRGCAHLLPTKCPQRVEADMPPKGGILVLTPKRKSGGAKML